jgi:hypothetical protein
MTFSLMDAIAEGGVPVGADIFRAPYHRRFFRLKVELSLDLRRPGGCLVTNSTAELASRDRATATRVGGVLANLEAAFHRAVVRAQDVGEIDTTRNPLALARFLTSSAQGLSVMAKTAPIAAFSTISSR